MMLPLDVVGDFGKGIAYFVFFLIGIGFGSILEMAGFGDSRKLASQFYLKDMTVLKTMFTGILVACLLIFLSSALGFLDFPKIYVPTTYLIPGILGGLLMGFGFLVGGYCPGTSVVSAASLKGDGMVFLLGVLIGVGGFGETVGSFESFWNSYYFDRYLLSDWLGWSIGATVFAVTLLALAMFYGAEKTEEFFRKKGTKEKVDWVPRKKAYILAASVALIFSLATWIVGQPDADRKWVLISDKHTEALTSRDVFVHPLEYVKTYNNAGIKLETLDLRPRADYDEFHLAAAKHGTLDDLLDTKFVKHYTQLPSNGLLIVIADDEAVAVKAWKRLKAHGVINLYILDKGLTTWKRLFEGKHPPHFHGNIHLEHPPVEILEMFPKDTFQEKIKLKLAKKSAGLCS